MPEAKRTHGQARPSYGPGVPGTGVFGNPRIPSHRSFRSRLRNAGTEIRRPKARGNDPRRPRGRTVRCPAGIRSVGVSGSRIVLEKDGSVLEFPKQSTSCFRLFPSQTSLVPKTGERKTARSYPPAYRHEQRFSTDRQKTEPSDNRRIATNKNGRTKIGLGGRPFRRGERIPRSTKKPGGRYGTKLGSFTSRRPDEGKIAIILSWYVSCI